MEYRSDDQDGCIGRLLQRIVSLVSLALDVPSWSLTRLYRTAKLSSVTCEVAVSVLWDCVTLIHQYRVESRLMSPSQTPGRYADHCFRMTHHMK